MVPLLWSPVAKAQRRKKNIPKDWFTFGMFDRVIAFLQTIFRTTCVRGYCP